jgi:cation diffusion facilitator CzcD-associated flavoprotein CzcO
MVERLGGDEELVRKMVPEWEVGCRRPTPGPGYLESFTKGHVSLDNTPIARVTPTGIRTSDGKHHEFDVIICATGFNVSHRPPYPLVGRYGIDLADKWSERPEGYLSICAAGFPNFFMFSGPNAPVAHGSLLSALGWTADYITKWLRKISEEDIKWVDVREDVSLEFNTYADEIQQTLVWTGGCRSWFKNNTVDGKVTAVWAGSALAYREMLENLRPEDFTIMYRSPNRFRFMGNGRTKREFQAGEDLAFYMQ